MEYLLLTVKEMPALAEIGCVALMVECDDDGEVTREIGGEPSMVQRSPDTGVSYGLAAYPAFQRTAYSRR